MRNTLVRLAFICLTLCASIASGRAELKFQSRMEETCRPAAPDRYAVLRWKQQANCNDCFTWRVTCSNNRSYQLQSTVHPGTTEFQYALYEWAPWSFLAYLLPFLIYVGIATLGSRFAAPLLASNVLFLAYMVLAAWALRESITGSPSSTSAVWERAVFLNPWVYIIVVGVFAVVNLPAVLRGLDDFFYRHTHDVVITPTMMTIDPMHAAHLSVALMPHLHEFVDPAETASYYRRHTERMRALKETLDAQTALAEAILRSQRRG